MESIKKEHQKTVKEFQISRNEYLKHSVTAFYNCDYTGYNEPDNPNFINTLKNNRNNESNNSLKYAMECVYDILKSDLPYIINEYHIDTICVVPRSKANFPEQKMLFKKTISIFVDNETKVKNGTDYIVRHTNTKTTHLTHSQKAREFFPDNDGSFPYPGITKDTCHISDKVKGENILLIDDIYTKSINIDEDCIQALYDFGTSKVYLYTIARTKEKVFIDVSELKCEDIDWDNIL